MENIKIPLILSPKIKQQIQYLCKKVSKVEWSGVLFYTIEGTLHDIKNLKLTAQEILPLNVGTNSYTEFSAGGNFVDYMDNNEYLENFKMGLVHSHNSMPTYFSKIDIEELKNNAPNYNFYLSFIVNNYMDFCAKFCFIAESDTQKAELISRDEDGYEYLVGETEIKASKLITYDCEIIEENFINLETDFVNQVDYIIAEKDIKEKMFASNKGYNGKFKTGNLLD